MSLLKLPWVASASLPCQAFKILAIIWVTVVLPLLPVTAINGKENCARQAWAIRPRAQRVSLTSKPISPASAKPCVAMAAEMPRPFN